MVAANRSATLSILTACSRFWESDIFESDDPISAYFPYIDYVALLPIIQTLSLVDFTFDVTSITPSTPNTPKLIRNARINVWANGMSSRTSYFGLVVACLGIIIALCQVILGIFFRNRFRSPMEFLVAALEHKPRDEFAGRQDSAIARTTFVVEDAKSGHASSLTYRRGRGF